MDKLGGGKGGGSGGFSWINWIGIFSYMYVNEGDDVGLMRVIVL